MYVALICLFLGLAHAHAFAEDTPSNMGAGSALLAAPRSAIAAQDWDRAIQELQAALVLEPHNADVHNLLGYSYRKRAQPDLPRAFFHYHEALRLNPSHRAAREYLGEAYLQTGQPDKAREQLNALESICGRECEEYRDLAAAISGGAPSPKAW
jgi:Flp pilus assembly protein TadD